MQIACIGILSFRSGNLGKRRSVGRAWPIGTSEYPEIHLVRRPSAGIANGQESWNDESK